MSIYLHIDQSGIRTVCLGGQVVTGPSPEVVLDLLLDAQLSDRTQTLLEEYAEELLACVEDGQAGKTYVFGGHE